MGTKAGGGRIALVVVVVVVVDDELMIKMCQGSGEMDLLLGGFANAEIDTLTEEELLELEHLLTAHDQDLYAWMTGRKPLPPEWDGPLYRRIITYHEAAGPAGFTN